MQQTKMHVSAPVMNVSAMPTAALSGYISLTWPHLLFTPRKSRVTVWRSDNIVICWRCSNCSPPSTLFPAEHIIFVYQSFSSLGSRPRCRSIDNNKKQYENSHIFRGKSMVKWKLPGFLEPSLVWKFSQTRSECWNFFILIDVYTLLNNI